jgi:hypothetical protein
VVVYFTSEAEKNLPEMYDKQCLLKVFSHELHKTGKTFEKYEETDKTLKPIREIPTLAVDEFLALTTHKQQKCLKFTDCLFSTRIHHYISLHHAL